jgi:glutamyl endopeptidase
MAAKLEWSTSPPLPAHEGGQIFEQLETQGSRGSTASPASKSADDFLVFGKSDQRLSSKTFRAGDETVIGEDERVEITDADKYPWRMIAALRLIPRPPFTSAYIGTGWFIGPKTLVTAGHCVYSQTDFGGWIGTIEVSPGRRGSNFPFGTAKATRFSALTVWQTTSNPDFDIGCIHLDEPLGNTVGFFKLASLDDAQLEHALLNISGYPRDRDSGRRQYFHANRALKTSARRIYYDIDTYGGQSGSPVWMQEAQGTEPIAVGVHAYGTGGTAQSLGITANSGPRLVPEVIATIQEWLAAA